MEVAGSQIVLCDNQFSLLILGSTYLLIEIDRRSSSLKIGNSFSRFLVTIHPEVVVKYRDMQVLPAGILS